MTATPTIGSSFLFIATKKKKGRDSFIERGTKGVRNLFWPDVRVKDHATQINCACFNVQYGLRVWYG